MWRKEVALCTNWRKWQTHDFWEKYNGIVLSIFVGNLLAVHFPFLQLDCTRKDKNNFLPTKKCR